MAAQIVVYRAAQLKPTPKSDVPKTNLAGQARAQGSDDMLFQTIGQSAGQQWILRPFDMLGCHRKNYRIPAKSWQMGQHMAQPVHVRPIDGRKMGRDAQDALHVQFSK
ncbi:hypothetical protein C1J05_05995 [Sulfitobacter sp. JL08]|nr:hypothetical protein C1J05_05995 [Sulfitobacter sp. JL08]